MAVVTRAEGGTWEGLKLELGAGGGWEFGKRS